MTQQTEARSRWLTGCGVGCGCLLLALLLVAGGCFYLAKSTVGQFQQVAESQELLAERFGDVEDFVPPADGAVAAERMEIFLRVRERAGGPRGELEAMLADFPPDEVVEGEGIGTFFRVLKSLGGLLRPISGYMEARNAVLLEEGMSLGEYLYVYSLAYYSWLGRSPEDGPVITKDIDDKGERILSGEDATFSPERLRERYHRFTLAFAESQLDALPAGDALREALAAEVARLRSDRGRVLWQDGLPPAIEASLGPYRERLEGSYSAAINCFELSPADQDDWQKRKGWRWRD